MALQHCYAAGDELQRADILLETSSDDLGCSGVGGAFGLACAPLQTTLLPYSTITDADADDDADDDDDDEAGC